MYTGSEMERVRYKELRWLKVQIHRGKFNDAGFGFWQWCYTRHLIKTKAKNKTFCPGDQAQDQYQDQDFFQGWEQDIFQDRDKDQDFKNTAAWIK